MSAPATPRTTRSVRTERSASSAAPSARADDRPVLVFFTRPTSGPCRRMDSLVAWVKVTERRRLRVVEADADENGPLMERLGVSSVPSLALVKDGGVVGRIEGRTTGHDIDAMIRPHLPPRD